MLSLSYASESVTFRDREPKLGTEGEAGKPEFIAACNA